MKKIFSLIVVLFLPILSFADSFDDWYDANVSGPSDESVSRQKFYYIKCLAGFIATDKRAQKRNFHDKKLGITYQEFVIDIVPKGRSSSVSVTLRVVDSYAKHLFNSLTIRSGKRFYEDSGVNGSIDRMNSMFPGIDFPNEHLSVYQNDYDALVYALIWAYGYK